MLTFPHNPQFDKMTKETEHIRFWGRKFGALLAVGTQTAWGAAILAAIAAVVIFPHAANAADWQGTAGGQMDDPAKWGLEAFGSSDTLYVNSYQSAPLSIGEDWSPYRLFIQAQGVGTNIIDLQGRSLLVSNRIFFENGTTVMLTNGTLGVVANGDRLFVGDGTKGGNTLIVHGPDAEVRGGIATGDASRYMVIGQKSSFNKLIVRKGGRLRGNFRFAGDSIKATNNLVLVTDPGSSFCSNEGTRNVQIGTIGGYNAVVVSNQAVFVASNGVHMAPYTLNSSSQNLGVSPGNRFEITDNATATVMGRLIVGRAGPSNVCTVSRGGRLNLSGDMLYVGQQDGAVSNAVGNLMHVMPGGTVDYRSTGYTGIVVGEKAGADDNTLLVEGVFEVTNGISGGRTGVGMFSASNRLIVANGGSFSIRSDLRNLLVGGENGSSVATSYGNLLAVTNGGVLSLCATQNESRVWIGAHGRNSGLICDAGTLDMPKWYLIIGGYLSASNAWGRIVNGSNVEVGRLIVSDKTPNCSLVVSNSTINITWGSFDVAYSAADLAASVPSMPTNVLVRIGGTNTSIRVFSQFRLTNDATLEFGIPAMQPMASPVIRCQAFNTTNRTFERKPTLRVTLDAEQRIGQRVTLIETTNDITDANWNNLVIDVPEGVTITREAKKIVATVRSTLGTMLIIR